MPNFISVPYALHPGSQVGDYEIEGVLGAGGFGIVYLAHNINIRKQRVAVKEFFPNTMVVREGEKVILAGNAVHQQYKQCLEYFKTEAEILVDLKHPNVVRCLTVVKANNTSYLVMDYEDGLTFEALLQQIEKQNKAYSQTQLLKVFLPLATGIESLHAAHVIHRDIKPANVFVSKDNGENPIIIDFGAAKANFSRVTQAPPPFTDFYAPPEQIEPASLEDVTAADQVSLDIHAFGGLMYRAVTQSLGPNAQKRMYARSTNKKDPLVSCRELSKGNFSQDLLVLIDDCLAYEPENRPASMSDVVSRLKAIKEAVYTKKEQAKEESRPAVDARTVDKTNKLVFIAVGLVVAFSLAFLIAFSVSDMKDKEVQLTQVQEGLSTLGYEVVVNGRLDDMTIEAIEEFEESQNLTISGEVGKGLIDSIQKALGKQGNIKRVQVALSKVGYSVPISGELNQRTSASISSYLNIKGETGSFEMDNKLVSRIETYVEMDCSSTPEVTGVSHTETTFSDVKALKQASFMRLQTERIELKEEIGFEFDNEVEIIYDETYKMPDKGAVNAGKTELGEYDYGEIRVQVAKVGGVTSGELKGGDIYNIRLESDMGIDYQAGEIEPPTTLYTRDTYLIKKGQSLFMGLKDCNRANGGNWGCEKNENRTHLVTTVAPNSNHNFYSDFFGPSYFTHNDSDWVTANVYHEFKEWIHQAWPFSSERFYTGSVYFFDPENFFSSLFLNEIGTDCYKCNTVFISPRVNLLRNFSRPSTNININNWKYQHWRSARWYEKSDYQQCSITFNDSKILEHKPYEIEVLNKYLKRSTYRHTNNHHYEAVLEGYENFAKALIVNGYMGYESIRSTNSYGYTAGNDIEQIFGDFYADIDTDLVVLTEIEYEVSETTERVTLYKLDLNDDAQRRKFQEIYNVYDFGSQANLEQISIEYADKLPLVILIRDAFGNPYPFLKDSGALRTFAAEPIVYLYPKEETDISFVVDDKTMITKSHPEYGSGWLVTAFPDGRLIDHNSKVRTHRLFWEGFTPYFDMQEKGFYVKQEDLKAFFEDILPKLGLNDFEASEFITSWLGILDDYPVYFITFYEKKFIDDLVPLEIEPAPDTLIRVLMDFKGVEKMEITESLVLPQTPKREGFTVVEWGGLIRGEMIDEYIKLTSGNNQIHLLN